VKTIHIENIGEVTIRKSKRARNVLLRISPFYGLRVTIPEYSSYKFAESVIYKKLEWLKNQLQNHKSKFSIFEPGKTLISKNYTLQINMVDSPVLKIRTTNGIIAVDCPKNTGVNNAEIQNSIQSEIAKVLKKEAKNFLPARVQKLAAANNFQFGKLSLRNQKTRWGSCSHNNNISLNIQLMRLSDIYIDYVILHELCHTVVKNHGIEFWKLMEKVLPAAKTIAREMRKSSPFMNAQ